MKRPETRRRKRKSIPSEHQVLGQLAACVSGVYLVCGLIWFGGGMYLVNAGVEDLRKNANPDWGEIPGLPSWYHYIWILNILFAIPELVGAWGVYKEKSWGYYVAISAFLIGIAPYLLLGAPKLLMAGLLFAALQGRIRWPLWQDAPPPPVPPPYYPPPPQRQIEQSSREKPRR